jgi:hypothetical protein
MPLRCLAAPRLVAARAQPALTPALSIFQDPAMACCRKLATSKKFPSPGTEDRRAR